ncbi:MAG TPA: hypothetical protein VI792_03220 [Candidatus Eisenbacteria bacterium]
MLLALLFVGVAWAQDSVHAFLNSPDLPGLAFNAGVAAMSFLAGMGVCHLRAPAPSEPALDPTATNARLDNLEKDNATLKGSVELLLNLLRPGGGR